MERSKLRFMTKIEMVSRYADLARQRSELFLQSGSGWNADIERREKAILGEMAALEAAIKLPVQEEQAIPEMLTIRKAAERTGFLYPTNCFLGGIQVVKPNNYRKG